VFSGSVWDGESKPCKIVRGRGVVLGFVGGGGGGGGVGGRVSRVTKPVVSSRSCPPADGTGGVGTGGCKENKKGGRSVKRSRGCVVGKERGRGGKIIEKSVSEI